MTIGTTGTAQLVFAAAPVAAEYVSSTVVTDSVPNPSVDFWVFGTRALPVSTGWIPVTYGNGVFVAVSYNTAIAATSPDGITWTQRVLPVSAPWQSVTYGNGVFVAIAYSTTIAATSPDGITWTQQVLPVSAAWQSVTYGSGIFMAVCNSTTIAATSPDGITWTQRVLPVSASWQYVTYGNGVFVAVANSTAIAATLATLGRPNTRTVTTVNTQTAPAKPVVGSNFASVTITGQTGLLATDNIDCWIQASDSTADHNATEHKIVPIKLAATNIVAGVGFDIYGISELRLDGAFAVRWAWAR